MARIGFATWADVLAYARLVAIEPSTTPALYYKAPLDIAPRRLRPLGMYGFRVLKETIRITPPVTAADPFTADAGHLNRFFREES